MPDMLARYEAAEAVLDTNVDALVLNERVAPHWMDGATFWYRRSRSDGGEYVTVGADGSSRPAFDHAAAATALGKLLGHSIDARRLDVEDVHADGEVILRHEGRRFSIDATGVSEIDPVPAALPGLLVSPAGDRALFARDHDLWLCDLATGGETRLTDDGEESYSWGQYPDSGLLGVVRRRSGLAFAPFGWSWSPGGDLLIGGRVDERAVEPYPFLEMVPQDGGVRPRVYSIRQPLVGEQGATAEAWSIEIATGRRTRIEDGELQGVSEPFDWSADGRRYFAATQSIDGRELGLAEVDPATGAVRTIMTERPPGFAGNNAELYNRPNIRIIGGGAQAIWYSERSGWGHLYRYDCATGEILNPITAGDWLVRDIIHVDEGRARLYFTASGREGGNPYHRRFYRVDFDGGNLILLTPDAADHMIDGAPIALLARLYGVPVPPPVISPNGSLFIESHSTVTAPGTTYLRSTDDGRVVALLEQADASALFATGWTAPEPFTAKAADGETDLYGVIYRPSADAARPAPVIDGIYGGPQVTVVPHNFRNARKSLGGYGRAALAKLGFAVVVVDGRGTPLRSRAFHDAGYGNFADVALDDHVAVLAQLCDRDATLDRDRIGIYGHSFGGYTSARAVLRHPDIYKVAVSSAGSHNLHGMYAQVAGVLPPPDYGDGSPIKPDITAVSNHYSELDTATLAANLRGKLLLAYGDMDENAYPAVTLLLYDALIKANRSPDLLCMPNRMHGFAHEPYYVRRLWDYFVTHLLGETPPRDYLIRGAAGAGGFG